MGSAGRIDGLAAIILCGGKSQRMGERKEWLTLGGETLLARAVRILCEVASPIVVATTDDSPVPPTGSSVRIVFDEEPGQGPLGGFVAGLAAVPESSLVFVTSCDAPFITPEVVRFLVESLGNNAAVVPVIAGFPQPLLAVYRHDVLDIAQQLMTTPGKGPRDLMKRVPTRLLHEKELQAIDPKLHAFQSFNTPEEWTRITHAFARDQ